MADTPSDSTLSATGGDGINPRDAGAAFLRQGNNAQAVTSLTAAIEADPNDEAAWRLLGGALSSAGQHDRAVEAFRRALDLLPLAAKNHYNLGIALDGAGKTAEAREAFLKALELDPGYEQASARLAALNQGSSVTPSEQSVRPSPMSSGLSAVGGAYMPEDSSSQGGHTNISGGTGMSQGMGSIGGGTPAASEGGTAVPNLSSPPPGNAYGSPPGGYVSPQGGGYAPPPQLGAQQYGQVAPDVGAKSLLTSAIVGILCFGIILGPYTWIKSNEAMKTLDQYPPNADNGQRSTVNTARIIGIIVTCLSILGIVGNIFLRISGN